MDNQVLAHASDERGDESDTGLGARDSLGKPEHKSQVAVDAVHLFKLSGSLNALPSGRDLDEYTLFANTDGLVERNNLPCLEDKMCIFMMS